jgi:hypothetical protein
VAGKRPLRLDALVEPGKLLPVAINGEAGNGPRDLAQEVEAVFVEWDTSMA